jgi:hypothetical protein
MHRFTGVLTVTLILLLGASLYAGSPHFVFCTFNVSSSSVSVLAKEAGLGNEDQVDAQLTGEVACINPGNHHPKADNKEAIAAAGTFPVQNGKADISLVATVDFQPECSPPMTLSFSNLLLTDLTSGISCAP